MQRECMKNLSNDLLDQMKFTKSKERINKQQDKEDFHKQNDFQNKYYTRRDTFAKKHTQKILDNCEKINKFFTVSKQQFLLYNI